MQGYAAQFSKEISNLLWRVPRELLLLLKTNDCLRSVDHALGQVATSDFLVLSCLSHGSVLLRDVPQQRPRG